MIKFRYILLCLASILLVGIILILGWLNYFNFEQSIIKAELRELLIIAKATSHAIENGVLSIKQEPEYIGKLIQHVNDGEGFDTFVLDNKHIILSDPIKSNIGKDILEVAKKGLNTKELEKVISFVKNLDSNNSGTAMLFFPTKDKKLKKEMKLFAFSNLGGQNDFYSIIVTENLSALTDPIHSSLRNMLVLIGMFFLVFIILGYIIYRIQKKKIHIEVTTRALEIINRQLRCDIEDYKSIEKGLKNYKNGRS